MYEYIFKQKNGIVISELDFSFKRRYKWIFPDITLFMKIIWISLQSVY